MSEENRGNGPVTPSDTCALPPQMASRLLSVLQVFRGQRLAGAQDVRKQRPSDGRAVTVNVV